VVVVVGVGGAVVKATVFIPGRPIGKERPRMGRGGRVYTPVRTRQWEAVLVNEFRSRSVPFPDGKAAPRVRVDCDFRFPSGTHPDCDNAWKCVADALGTYWGVNDKNFTGSFRFTVDKRRPGVYIRLKELGGGK